MKSIVAVVCLLCVAVSHAHMYLRTPVSRAGVNSAGGTTADCSVSVGPNTAVTPLVAGQTYTFQFRVNQHGPVPFAFTLFNGATQTVLRDNIPNTVTAGPDSFDGVNVDVTLPANLPACENCFIQLAGMGQANGNGKWYNCAQVRILAAGSTLPVTVSSLNPTSSTTAGGVSVVVTGQNFPSTNPGAGLVKCKFDSTIVNGAWTSSTTATCLSPPRNGPTTSNNPCTVEISFDGGNSFSLSGRTISYTGASQPVTITSISPQSGDPGTVLVIVGQNFYSHSVECQFGNKTVAAIPVSFTQVTCQVPVQDAFVPSVPVQIRLDANAFSSNLATSPSFVYTSNNPPEGSGSDSNKFAVAIAVLASLWALVIVGVLIIKYRRDGTLITRDGEQSNKMLPKYDVSSPTSTSSSAAARSYPVSNPIYSRPETYAPEAIPDTRPPAPSSEWVELVDQSTGVPYYYNKRTQQSVWERPASY